MSEQPHQRTKFLTFERPLLPPPPLDADRYEWYLGNTLAFYRGKEKVWEQKIPEADISWVPSDADHAKDDFRPYFGHFEVFKVEVFKDGDRFGWQIRFSLTHRSADFWYDKIQKYLKQRYKEHFEPKPQEGGR